jgi:hypothetical protein
LQCWRQSRGIKAEGGWGVIVTEEREFAFQNTCIASRLSNDSAVS